MVAVSDLLQELEGSGLSKRERLKQLVTQIPGLYAPCFYAADEHGSVSMARSATR